MGDYRRETIYFLFAPAKTLNRIPRTIQLDDVPFFKETPSNFHVKSTYYSLLLVVSPIKLHPSQVLQTLSGRCLDLDAILEHFGALSAGAGVWKEHVDWL